MAGLSTGTMAVPFALKFATATLPSKPDADLHYSFLPSPKETSTLVVFINGLVAPQESWMPTIALLSQQQDKDDALAGTALLAYDRFGQGRTTSRDPLDKDMEPGRGHNAVNVAEDLHALIPIVCKAQGLTQPAQLVFVCNSIGSPIARLYAQHYPGTVSAIIFLDSMIANTDFVSLFPDPDGPDFDKTSLPEGVSVEDLRATRAITRKVFHPDTLNPEGLDRSKMASLLPDSATPVLQGPNGIPPFIVVVGHDPEHFATETETGMMKTPRALTMKYLNPAWHKYNQGLTRLSTRSKGPIIAPGCGHFVQRDDPSFVANLIVDLLRDIKP